MYPDRTRAVFGHKTLLYLEKDMSLFLSRRGVLPILIPDLPESELIEFLNQMDAFVFQGGADLAPSSYGEEGIENNRWPGDPHRDHYELKIMDFAFQNKKPVLAVCRGFQVMNVYLGGTLYQDLALQTQTKIIHRDAETYDRVHHEVQLESSGILAEWYGKRSDKKPTLMVNSVHHQGVKTLGRDLIVDAVCADDKLIEAFHYKDLNTQFAVAVQWHPEFSHTLKNTVADPNPLYDEFLKAVEKGKKKGEQGT